MRILFLMGACPEILGVGSAVERPYDTHPDCGDEQADWQNENLQQSLLASDMSGSDGEAIALEAEPCAAPRGLPRQHNEDERYRAVDGAEAQRHNGDEP
jgi:hypothetical protein